MTLPICCSLGYTSDNRFNCSNSFGIPGAPQVCSAVNYCLLTIALKIDVKTCKIQNVL